MFCASFHFSEKAVFSAISAVRRLRHTFFARARDPTCRSAITITGCGGQFKRAAALCAANPSKATPHPGFAPSGRACEAGSRKNCRALKAAAKIHFYPVKTSLLRHCCRFLCVFLRPIRESGRRSIRRIFRWRPLSLAGKTSCRKAVPQTSHLVTPRSCAGGGPALRAAWRSNLLCRLRRSRRFPICPGQKPSGAADNNRPA